MERIEETENHSQTIHKNTKDNFTKSQTYLRLQTQEKFKKQQAIENKIIKGYLQQKKKYYTPIYHSNERNNRSVQNLNNNSQRTNKIYSQYSKSNNSAFDIPYHVNSKTQDNLDNSFQQSNVILRNRLEQRYLNRETDRNMQHYRLNSEQRRRKIHTELLKQSQGQGQQNPNWKNQRAPEVLDFQSEPEEEIEEIIVVNDSDQEVQSENPSFPQFRKEIISAQSAKPLQNNNKRMMVSHSLNRIVPLNQFQKKQIPVIKQMIIPKRPQYQYPYKIPKVQSSRDFKPTQKPIFHTDDGDSNEMEAQSVRKTYRSLQHNKQIIPVKTGVNKYYQYEPARYLQKKQEPPKYKEDWNDDIDFNPKQSKENTKPAPLFRKIGYTAKTNISSRYAQKNMQFPVMPRSKSSNLKVPNNINKSYVYIDPKQKEVSDFYRNLENNKQVIQRQQNKQISLRNLNQQIKQIQQNDMQLQQEQAKNNKLVYQDKSINLPNQQYVDHSGYYQMQNASDPERPSEQKRMIYNSNLQRIKDKNSSKIQSDDPQKINDYPNFKDTDSLSRMARKVQQLDERLTSQPKQLGNTLQAADYDQLLINSMHSKLQILNKIY